MAVIVSNLAARGRAQAVAATARARTTNQLYAFSRKLAGVGTLDDVLWALGYQIASMLAVRVVVLLPEAGRLEVKGAYPPEDFLDDADLAAARWALESGRAAGRGADTLPGAKRLFLPMRTERGSVGVVGIDSDRTGAMFTPDQRRLLDALIDQGAVAVERVNVVESMQAVRQTMEAEKLRSALLTSISHDLKTPLAAVLGAAGALRDMEKRLSPADRADLLQTIIDESERLNRFIANLLDMTRLESGAVAPNRSPQDLNEIVGSTLRRAEKILARHPVALELDKNLPLLDLDPVLTEQALFNLLDNAAKYAAEGSTITLRTERLGQSEALQVADEGAGIPPEDVERIFDKFYRVRKADHVRAGTGLGLGIARGFVEAMGGALTAANRVDRRGAVFTITFPLAPALMREAVA
jgi:two-component system sensor histidine kinase KdpD